MIEAGTLKKMRSPFPVLTVTSPIDPVFITTRA